MGILRVVEKGRGCGGDPVFLENLLRIDLGGLQSGPVRFRAVGGDAERQKPVNQSQRERHFWSHHDKLDVFPSSEPDQTGDVIGGNGMADGFSGDAGVAWRCDHPWRGRGTRAASAPGRVRGRLNQRQGLSEEGRSCANVSSRSLRGPEASCDRRRRLHRGRRRKGCSRASKPEPAGCGPFPGAGCEDRRRSSNRRRHRARAGGFRV
jgi:hypothetical protein